MLNEQQCAALDDRAAAINERAWQAAALMGLPQARARCEGRWPPVKPPEQGLESYLVAHALGLPPPLDCEIELWRVPGNMHPSSDQPERLYRGPAEDLVPALLETLKPEWDAYIDDELAYDVFPTLKVVDADAYYASLESAEEAGEEVIHHVNHPTVPLWLLLGDNLHLEGKAEVCDGLTLPDGLLERVVIAWVQTNNSSDPLYGHVVART